jgi:predicted dehydrogenase
METYRVAILGCRARGTAAARAYAAHPRTEVAALCDLVPERAAELGAELGVRDQFTDLDEMMARIRPDLVAIPTGTEYHYELSRRVLEYGAHIDVEKPLCTDLEQADALVEQARAKGVRIAVHHQRRVGPSLQAVRKALREGRIGEIRHLIGSCKGYYGGYGLMNIGTHMVNDLLELLGRCRAVTATAMTGGRPITPEDVVVSPGGMGIVVGERITATLEFDRGVTATTLFHRFPRADSAAYMLEALGTEGRLFWKTTAVWWLPTPHFVPDGERDGWQPLLGENPEGYDPASGAGVDEYAHVDAYVRALDEGREHPSSGEEGRHVLEVLMGILEAAAYGRRVELPQPRRDHPLLRWRREHGLGAPLPGPRPYGDWLAVEDERIRNRG